MGWLTRAFGGDARAPRDVDAALRGALLATLSRDWEQAEHLLISACRLDSRAVEPYLALARLLRSRGEIGRAIRIHQNLLLRLESDSAEGRRALAGLAADFHEGGFLRRAIAAYEDVLAGESKHEPALRALAQLHAEAREFERAIEMERRLAKLEGRAPGPAEAVLRVQMAEAAQAEGRSDVARRALRQALRRDKRCAPAWLLLGAVEAERDRPKAALAAWKRVPEFDPQAGASVYPQLEATFATLGKARDFEVFLRKRLEGAPGDAVARVALARHLGARGDLEEALGELRRVLSRDPDDREARICLGRLLLAGNRDSEAVKEYAELLDALDRRGPALDLEEVE
ncbi:MAG: tetratricopeptide repeat protein [Deltaproteobacteria bacterium]|nr:tetratricopeptide repeat protein [Deltaproteobacteria bacterium]MBW2360316.1 tetratricopeptide repeat protein [Deltaproteobacteria bacterium]